MADEGVHELVLRHRPQLDGLVLGGREDLVAVGAEGDAADGRRVSLEVGAPALDGVDPQANGFVAGTRCQQVARGRERNSRHRLRMATIPKQTFILGFDFKNNKD